METYNDVLPSEKCFALEIFIIFFLETLNAPQKLKKLMPFYVMCLLTYLKRINFCEKILIFYFFLFFEFSQRNKYFARIKFSAFR